jgi:tetratricopeptide (TPR) repeat protein
MNIAVNLPETWGQPKARTESEIFTKGMKLMDRKRYAAAQKNFDILLLLNPFNIDAMLQRGICKMHAGLVNPALDDFSEILLQVDGKPEAYAAMAQAYWMLADFEMAKHFIDETLKSNYTLRAEWYELGCNIYNKLGDVNTAYACINRAIVCDPFDAVLYYKRARILFGMGKLQVAINDLTKAISFESKFVNAFKLRAQCKKALGDFEGSRKDLMSAGLYHKA